MRVLYVGCGGDMEMSWLPQLSEVTRLDIDPAVAPDIVADMCKMGDIGEYDMVYSCHSLEHLYPHDVAKALGEFYRVLSPTGYAVILVPDLQDVRATDEVLFESAAGPIAGLDLIYGHRASIAECPFMAHRTGFMESTLREALAAFPKVTTKRLPDYNLLAVACKT